MKKALLGLLGVLLLPTGGAIWYGAYLMFVDGLIVGPLAFVVLGAAVVDNAARCLFRAAQPCSESLVKRNQSEDHTGPEEWEREWLAPEEELPEVINPWPKKRGITGEVER